jgi:CCR4-NOT transcription complex subunit 6
MAIDNTPNSSPMPVGGGISNGNNANTPNSSNILLPNTSGGLGSNVMMGLGGGGASSRLHQKQIEQLILSRQSASPHHRARIATAAARTTSTNNSLVNHSSSLNNVSMGSGMNLSMGMSTDSITSFNNNINHETSATSTPNPPNALANTAGGSNTQLVSNSINNNSNNNSMALTTISSNNNTNSLSRNTTIGTGASTTSQWTAIDIGGMQVKNLSPTLFQYTFLTTLYLNHNNLTYLSHEISRLKSLTLLDLSGNKLSSLPPELGLVVSLRELLVFDNQLSFLPPELGFLYQVICPFFLSLRFSSCFLVFFGLCSDWLCFFFAFLCLVRKFMVE